MTLVTTQSSSTTQQPRPPLSNQWSRSRLKDEFFNDMMRSDNHDEKGVENKYVDQFEEKFQHLRIGSPTTCFDISLKDLRSETKQHIKEFTRDCKTPVEAHRKLNGIIPDVIAGIAKQTEHRILAKSSAKDDIQLKKALASVREIASNHWKFTA